MTVYVADRAFQTTTSTGTGALNLGAARPGYQVMTSAFGMVDAETRVVSYTITQDNEFETGIGTLTKGATDTLARDVAVHWSSNSNALVNFGSGTKNVFISPSAKLVAYKDESGNFVQGADGSVGGTANAQTLTFNPAPTGYSDGEELSWYSVGNTTGAVTVNKNGLGAKTLKWRGEDIPSGGFKTGDLIVGRYRSSTGFVELATAPRQVPSATKTANYTAAVTDTFIPVDATSGAITITLYTASGNAGKRIKIKKIDNTLNAVTIDGAGSETIDGDTTKVLSTRWEALELECDGTNWLIVARFGTHTKAVAYTPTLTEFGTVTNLTAYSRRSGKYLEGWGKFTSGTPTASEARLTLGFNGVDGGLTIDSGEVPTGTSIVGIAGRSTSGALADLVLAEPSVGYVTFGIQSAGAGALTKQAANAIAGSGTVRTFNFRVPITGWEA